MNNTKRGALRSEALHNYKRYGVLCLEFHQNYLYALARKEFGTSKFIKLPGILETSYQRDINFYDVGRKHYHYLFQGVRKYFRYIRG